MTDLEQSAMHRQAITAIRERQFMQAEQICQRALRRRRKDIQALSLLAHVHHQTGRDHEAIEELKTCLAIDSRSHELRLALGQVYAQRGMYQKSLTQLDAALRLQPDMEEAIITKGNVLERQGQHARARKLLEPRVNGPQPSPGMAATLMRILVRDGQLDEAIAIGERVAATDPEPTMWTRDVHFALARAFENKGEYEASFRHASIANGQLPLPYDPASQVARVDHLIETFSATRLAAAPAAPSREVTPIFIVGMPRTGSTLVERIIHSHPDAFGAGESTAMALLVDRAQMEIGSTLPYPACVEDLDGEDVRRLGDAYLSQLGRDAGRARCIVDKMLSNFMHVGFIRMLFPDARVLDCRRDPVDTCLSCFMERLTPASAPFATDLRHLGAYYREYERLMRHWHEATPDTMLTVSYEELIGDQEACSRQIIEFCGLPWDDRCLRFYESKRYDNTLSYDQVRRPLYSSSMGRAERFGALLDPLREMLNADRGAVGRSGC